MFFIGWSAGEYCGGGVKGALRGMGRMPGIRDPFTDIKQRHSSANCESFPRQISEMEMRRRQLKQSHLNHFNHHVYNPGGRGPISISHDIHV